MGNSNRRQHNLIVMRQLQQCLFQIAAHVVGATGIRESTLVQVVGQVESTYYSLWQQDESLRRSVDTCLQIVAAADEATQQAAAEQVAERRSQRRPLLETRTLQHNPVAMRAPVVLDAGAGGGSNAPTAPVTQAMVTAPMVDSRHCKNVLALRASLDDLRRTEQSLLRLPDAGWREKLSGLVQSRLRRVEAAIQDHAQIASR